MGQETILFKMEEKHSRDSVAQLLRQLAKKLEKGQVVLKQGKNEVTLEIPDRVELEIKAEKEVGKKRVKKKIEIEIEWVVGGEKNSPKEKFLLK